MARFIGINQGNLLKLIDRGDIPEKYIYKVRQYIKLFEVKDLDHPDIKATAKNGGWVHFPKP